MALVVRNDVAVRYSRNFPVRCCSLASV